MLILLLFHHPCVANGKTIIILVLMGLCYILYGYALRPMIGMVIYRLSHYILSYHPCSRVHNSFYGFEFRYKQGLLLGVIFVLLSRGLLLVWESAFALCNLLTNRQN